ncbi:conserved hypothetical protein, partial [Ricinus communis]
NKVWDGKKKNASKAKAEYAEIQSIANSIPFVMVEPLFRGYEVKGQGSCQAKKKGEKRPVSRATTAVCKAFALSLRGLGSRAGRVATLLSDPLAVLEWHEATGTKES